jgi:hypothetical protein
MRSPTDFSLMQLTVPHGFRYGNYHAVLVPVGGDRAQVGDQFWLPVPHG